MWRDLFVSTRNRGRGGEGESPGGAGKQIRRTAPKVRENPGSTSTTARRADEEKQVKPRPSGEAKASGTSPANAPRNVSRETWLPPAEEDWKEPTAADTPIGAEAERAVRILHKQGQHLR